jgi:hypothetical protein
MERPTKADDKQTSILEGYRKEQIYSEIINNDESPPHLLQSQGSKQSTIESGAKSSSSSHPFPKPRNSLLHCLDPALRLPFILRIRPDSKAMFRAWINNHLILPLRLALLSR